MKTAKKGKKMEEEEIMDRAEGRVRKIITLSFILSKKERVQGLSTLILLCLQMHCERVITA